MARGAIRGAVSACFGLAVLQVVTTHGGSSRIAGAFDIANSVVKRAFDPDVPAIPDKANGGGVPIEQAPGVTAAVGPKAPDTSVPPNPNRVPVPNGPAVPYF